MDEKKSLDPAQQAVEQAQQHQQPTKSFNSLANEGVYQPDNAECVEEFIKTQLQDHPKDRLFMLNIEKELMKFLSDEK